MSNQGGIKTRNPALAAALGDLHEAKLRDVINKLAASNPAVETALQEALFVSEDQVSDAPARKRKADEMSPDGEADAKRPMQPRYRTCQNCEKNFDVTDNGPEACSYHLENSEADYDGDFWADHDEDCHGIIEDLRDEYPEGFIYPCCGNDGTHKGCQVQKHEARPL